MDTNLVILNAVVGAILSQVCEQGAFFKDPTQAPLKKILAVLGLCTLWTLVFTLLSVTSLPLTFLDWRNFIITAVATAAGSQVFHLAIALYLPTLGSTTVTTTTNGTTVTQTKARGVKLVPPVVPFEILVKQETANSVVQGVDAAPAFTPSPVLVPPPGSTGASIGGASTAGGLNVAPPVVTKPGT